MTDLPVSSDVFPAATEVASVLAQMGAVVLSTDSVDATVRLVTVLAAETIPGTSGAGVTLVDARGKRTAAASDVLVERADALQYRFDDGPCLTAWRDQLTVRSEDVASENRWPQWSAEAAGLGVRSMLSVPLVADRISVGAIKVYSGHPHSYGIRAERLLELFARQAAVLLVNTQTLADARLLSAQLTDALINRDIIGQAKGVLIAQGAPDDQAAFAMLVAASKRTNVKLHDVARQLVTSVADRHRDRPTV